jgi:hypothetical protein
MTSMSTRLAQMPTRLKIFQGILEIGLIISKMQLIKPMNWELLTRMPK